MQILLRVVQFDPDTPLPEGIVRSLSPGRRARCEGYRLCAAAKSCAYGELLLRRTLGEVLGQIPEIRLEEGPYGKPLLLSHPQFRFSLSDTRGYAAVALGAQEVGLDIERQRPVDLRTARRFTKQEQDFVGQGEGALARFFYVWTRKEAYMKYQGKGFALPMKGFSVLPGGEGEAIASFQLGDLHLALCAGESPPEYSCETLTEEALLAAFGQK